MPSFWKHIELSQNSLRVICAQPAMHAIAMKMQKNPIKFTMTTQIPWFSVTSVQSFALAKMVHEVSTEKNYDPSYALTSPMLNAIGDAMIFGFENKNLRQIRPAPLTFAAKSRHTVRLATKNPQATLLGPTELYAARLSGDPCKVAQIKQAGIAQLRSKNPNKTQNAIHICLQKYADTTLKENLAEAHLLSPEKFVAFLHTLQELLLAGCNPDYRTENESLATHPTLFVVPTFANACTYAIIQRNYQPGLLAQIANILALLIQHGALVPRKDEAPFKSLDHNSFKIFKEHILLAYNAQNPETTVQSWEELAKRNLRKRNRPD